MSRAALTLARTGLDVIVGPSRKPLLTLAAMGCVGPTFLIAVQGGHMDRSAFFSASFFPTLLAEVALRAPRDPSRTAQLAPPLPALPVRTYDRAVARVLLALLSLVPGLLIMLVRTGPGPTLVQATTLAGSATIVALWAPVSERPSLPDRRTVAATLFSLLWLANILTRFIRDSPLVAILAAAVGLMFTRYEDDIAHRLGLVSPGTLSAAPYRAYAPLDGEGPLGAPPASPSRALAALGQRAAIWRALRHGLLLGAAFLPMSALFEAMTLPPPLGDREEVAAFLHNLLANPMSWSVPQLVLAAVACVFGIRSTVLPGHSAHPDQRANALAPLRWLPVSHADVWRETARTTLLAWWAFGLGAILPTLPLLLWHPDTVAQRVLLLTAGTLVLGSGLSLVTQARGPLQALTQGAVRVNASSLLPSLLAGIPAVVLGPMLLLSMGFPMLPGLVSVPNALPYDVIVGLVALGWFQHKRAAATRSPAP